MAEEYVSRDQHRADLAEQRTEFKDELHGVRQEVIVLAKTVEALGQRMEQGFAQMNQRFEDMQKQSQWHFEAIQKQANQRSEDLQRQLDQRFAQVDQQFDVVRQDPQRVDARLLSVENWIRVTFVMLALFGLGVVAQLVFIIVRFGLKP